MPPCAERHLTLATTCWLAARVRATIASHLNVAIARPLTMKLTMRRLLEGGLQDLGSQARGRAAVPAVGVPSPNHWTNREPQTPGNIIRSEVSPRSSFQHQDPALPNTLQTAVLEASGQTTSNTETQSHSLKKGKKK